MRRDRILFLACAGLAALTSCRDAAEPAPPAVTEPRATMHRIFDALVEVLPDALDEERFADPHRAAAIRARLEEMAAASDRLEEHAAGRDVDFGYLSRSLAADLEEARRRFGRGDMEEARFYVISATQNCVTCHSRVPSARDFPMAKRLTERVEIASLPPRDRAHFYMVTRRFEDALTTWEEFFADPATTSSQLDAAGTLFDYLTVSLRVERDPARARRTLERLAERPDLRGYLHDLVTGWVQALDDVADDVTAAPSLERAKALLARAENLSSVPAGPERAVHHLAASAHLHQLIDGATEPSDDLAEAYCLLGQIEAETVDSFWVPQAEFHLETAIRIAPGSAAAEKAYGLLEQYTALGFGGATGENLPDDVRAKLNELRALIDAAQESS